MATEKAPPPSSPPASALPPSYTLLTTPPSIETYTRLRHTSGLSPKSTTAARLGLPNTIHSAQIRHDPTATIVAMGRLIGDGGLFFQVVDMAVDPAHQGKGLGKAIMGELMRWCERNVEGGGYVSLVADGDAKWLYGKFGFRDVGPESLGMAWEREMGKEEEKT